MAKSAAKYPENQWLVDHIVSGLKNTLGENLWSARQARAQARSLAVHRYPTPEVTEAVELLSLIADMAEERDS